MAAALRIDPASAASKLPDEMRPIEENAIEAAEKAGFDLSLVDASLALSHEGRARQHDQALSLVLEFDRLRRERDAKLERPSSAPS
jgi:hypothetical protein